MNDIPTGFLMALAENEQAMRRFGALPANAREQVVAQAKAANSHHQMQAVANSLAEQGWTDG